MPELSQKTVDRIAYREALPLDVPSEGHGSGTTALALHGYPTSSYLWRNVAAEAAAAGSLPLVADHSGLAEIATGVASEYPEAQRDLTSFASGDAVDLAGKLRRLLALSPAERAELSVAARHAVVTRWSWEGVSQRLLEPFA